MKINHNFEEVFWFRGAHCFCMERQELSQVNQTQKLKVCSFVNNRYEVSTFIFEAEL